jgi:hypothetical protein
MSLRRSHPRDALEVVPRVREARVILRNNCTNHVQSLQKMICERKGKTGKKKKKKTYGKDKIRTKKHDMMVLL